MDWVIVPMIVSPKVDMYGEVTRSEKVLGTNRPLDTNLVRSLWRLGSGQEACLAKAFTSLRVPDSEGRETGHRLLPVVQASNCQVLG